MKRLKLEAFIAKNTDKKTTHQVDQLLGQVLGDCHDDNKVPYIFCSDESSDGECNRWD